jgi:hypothetical protein
MDGTILAHGSGIDELMIFVFPVVVAFGFWLIIRRPAGEAEDEEDPPSHD